MADDGEISVALPLTEDEIVTDRLEAVAKMPERYGDNADDMQARWSNEVAYREAMHASWIFCENVEGYLVDHPCVIFDAEAYRLARIAHAALFELYQRIGRLSHEAASLPETPESHIMSVHEQRWRYEKTDGTPVWLAFDPAFRCVYCDRPVGALSMGGPAVCSACDCGYSAAGIEWTYADFKGLATNARRRIDELPPDSAWAEYESDYRRKQTNPEPTAER